MSTTTHTNTVTLPGLPDEDAQIFVHFQREDGKVLFSLPALGSPGVPMGVMTAFSLFWEPIQRGASMTDRAVSTAWNLLITSLADAYPDAVRALASLDTANVAHVMTNWVQKSTELAGYDPKA